MNYLLNNNQISDFLSNSSGWSVCDELKLSKEFIFISYHDQMSWVQSVGLIAEELNHHPVLHLYYKKVALEVWTFSKRGITDLDLQFARCVDKLKSS